jgi:hypothetical protein
MLINQFKPSYSVYVGCISGIILVCMTYVHLDLLGFHWFKGRVRKLVEIFYLPYNGELFQLMIALTPGTRSPLQLNSERWRLKFMNPNYGTCFKSPTWRLQFWSDSWILGNLCICVLVNPTFVIFPSNVRCVQCDVFDVTLYTPYIWFIRHTTGMTHLKIIFPCFMTESKRYHTNWKNWTCTNICKYCPKCPTCFGSSRAILQARACYFYVCAW